MTKESVCRECGSVGADIFASTDGKRTKKPICRDCYERRLFLQSSTLKRSQYSRDYVGPRKDPFHRTIQRTMKEEGLYWDDPDDFDEFIID